MSGSEARNVNIHAVFQKVASGQLPNLGFNQVLVRFALERILYRLSQSQHADRFLLKGALLTDEFAHDSSRQSLWLAFLKKNELPPEPLPAIVERLRVALARALNNVDR